MTSFPTVRSPYTEPWKYPVPGAPSTSTPRAGQGWPAQAFEKKIHVWLVASSRRHPGHAVEQVEPSWGLNLGAYFQSRADSACAGFQRVALTDQATSRDIYISSSDCRTWPAACM